MRFTIAPILFSTLLVTACATSQQQENDQTAASSPAVPEAHDYVCESGETIIASYPDPDSAKVHYKGSAHAMQIAVSGSGARYVGDGLEWWTKGSGSGSHGTLFQHKADDRSGKRLESCTVK